MNLLIQTQNLLGNTIMLSATLGEIKEYLPFLIPFIILELVLAITALVHVLKHRNYKFGNTVIWVVIVLLIQIIGPVAYFAFGKGEE